MTMDILNLVIALLALVLSSFVFVREYLLPGKVELFVGDSFQIVNGDRNKIQIYLNLTNQRSRLSVVNHLEATLKSPNGNTYHYVWNVFYRTEYTDGAITALPDTFPTSISVLAKSSVLKGIEFIANDYFSWAEGTYEFKLLGWSNRGTDQISNIDKTIRFSLIRADVEKLILNETRNNLALSWPVKISN